MAGGLFALLDDVAALAKFAAASVDDIGMGAAKASAKSAGVIIDDAAVSPQYVQGVSAERELSVVRRIARGSIRNKFLFIIPAAMVLSAFAPWALPVLLIIGGSYLAYEGAEKVLALFGLGHGHGEAAVGVGETAEATENRLVNGAVRTDLVLSTEIMLIALSNITTDSIIVRLGTLIVVAVLMTVAVYGAVAALVRMDDLGVRLTHHGSSKLQAVGRGLVRAMPGTFSTIAIIGTAAMLWVGGHLLLKETDELGLHGPYAALHVLTHAVEEAGPLAVWVTDTTASAVAGFIVGLLLVAVVACVKRLRHAS